MARIFPLSLILCCCCSQVNGAVKIKLVSGLPQASKTPVELKCETDVDRGVYWIHQNLDLSTHFIRYTSSTNKRPETVNGYTASKISGNVYQLTIDSFGEEYEGIYHCFYFHNLVVHISSGLKVCLPKATTVAPQISTPSEEPTTTLEFPHSTGSDDVVMFPCELYIWGPLAGGCLLLLVMLVITLSVCCDPRRRRRRCRCKRPLNGTNGKVTMSRLIT